MISSGKSDDFEDEEVSTIMDAKGVAVESIVAIETMSEMMIGRITEEENRWFRIWGWLTEVGTWYEKGESIVDDVNRETYVLPFILFYWWLLSDLHASFRS